MNVEEILVSCEKGHVFALKEFSPLPEVTAAISFCPLEVPSEDHGGLILPCGGRVLWRRHSGLDRKAKVVRFHRERQLDLFYDRPLTDQSPDAILASEGQS